MSMKVKLLESLIDKLHLIPDGPSESEGEEEALPELGEESGEEKEHALDVGDESGGPAFDLEEKKSELDAAEHSHGDDEACSDECPVRKAIKKKLGK